MFSCFQTPSLLSFTVPGLGSRAELLLLGGFHGGSQPGSHFNPSQTFGTAKYRHQGPRESSGLSSAPSPSKIQGFFPRTGRSDILFPQWVLEKPTSRCHQILHLLKSYKIFLIQQEKELREHLLFLELGSVHY